MIMSKHQSCYKCRCDFVGPDSNIGFNLCDECYNDVYSDKDKTIAEQAELIERLESKGKAKSERIAKGITLLERAVKRIKYLEQALAAQPQGGE